MKTGEPLGNFHRRTLARTIGFVAIVCAVLAFPTLSRATTIGVDIETEGLTANGALKFTSGAVANYILTSDGAGNATWIAVDSALGFSDSDALSEGTVNLFYTDARVDDRIDEQKGVAGGLATLDGAGEVPASQIPSLAITNTFVVADEAERLALDATVGDVAVQTDENATYILQTNPATNPANWIQIVTPASSGVLLSSIEAATGANTIANGDHAQRWNWSLTTAGKSGLLFSEDVASTATGLSSILSARTLGTSTAMPLYIQNLGDADSFRVDDSTSDTSPFLINDIGQVLIGSDTFGLEKLKVEADPLSPGVITGNGDIDDNLFFNILNRNSGPFASSIISASADNTTGLMNSMAMGMTSSGFSNPSFPLVGPNSGLVFSAGKNLLLGTLLPTGLTGDSSIQFVTSTTGVPGVHMMITGAGDVGVRTMTPGSELDVKGELRLSGSSSGYVGFAPAADAGSVTYTLPDADGTAGQALTTDGSGILSWDDSASHFQRVGTTISPAVSGDDITTSGSIYTTGTGTIISAGLLTGQTGLVITGGDVSLNDNSNFDTTVNTGTSTGAVTIGNSLAGAVQVTSGSALTLTGGTASSFATTSGNITLQPAGTGTTAAAQIGAGGGGSTTPDLLGLDVKSSAGDPAGFNGAMYYNASSNTFRCFVNGSWAACDTTGGSTTLQSAYNAGATITTAAGVDVAFTLSDGDFTVSGADAVLLTPTGASSFTSGGALTLTGGASSTWGTSAGNLSLQVAGAGTTANVQIGAGGAGSTTPDIFALDVKSSAGDPAGFNGAMYYNASANLFRCYEAGAWKDCGATGAGASTLQQSYMAGNTINTNATDGDFTVTGTESVLLTPDGASSFTSGDALTLTAGASSTWSTTAGNLTIDSAAALELGTTNATSVSIGSTGVLTSVDGPLTASETLTASNGLTLTTGALNLTATSGALALSGLGTSSISTGANSFSITGSPLNLNTTGTGAVAIGNGTGTFLLNSNALDISTSGVLTGGTWQGTTIGIGFGGTGQTTQTAAFDALAPTSVKGDLILYNGTDNVRLPVGTNGQVLIADSTQSTGARWGESPFTELDFDNFADSMTLDATTTIGLNGHGLNITGTGSVSITPTGALTLSSTSGSLALSGLGASSINTGGNALTITSSNFNTTATGINGTNIGATTRGTGAFTSLSLTSALTVPNGGTGATSFTSNGVLYGNGTGAVLVTSAGTAGQCLVVGAGGAPEWAACSGGAGVFTKTGTNLSPTTAGDDLLLNTGETLTIGGGTTISNHLSGTATLDFPVIANNSCETLTITVTGATTGDTVVATPTPTAGGVGTLTNTVWTGHVSAANTVAVRACKLGTGTADPASQSWRADVWKH